jgi:hypothetical protein
VISISGANGLPEKSVEDQVVSVKPVDMSYIPFLTQSMHKLHFLLIECLMTVNSWTVSVFPSKSNSVGKVIIRDAIPITLGHLMHLSCISIRRHIQCCKELGYCFLVPIKLEAYYFFDVKIGTCSHNLIKDWVILLLHMTPINSPSL